MLPESLSYKTNPPFYNNLEQELVIDLFYYILHIFKKIVLCVYINESFHIYLYSSHNGFRIKSELKRSEYTFTKIWFFEKPKTKLVLVYIRNKTLENLLDKEKAVSFWIESSEDDWMVSNHLFERGDYSYSLFFGLLTIEKFSFKKKCTKSFTEMYLSKIKEMKEWLSQKI